MAPKNINHIIEKILLNRMLNYALIDGQVCCSLFDEKQEAIWQPSKMHEHIKTIMFYIELEDILAGNI